MPRYQHFDLFPLKEILPVLNIESITKSIKDDVNQVSVLKLQLLSGITLSLVLYDIQKFYHIVEWKYINDFFSLKAAN